MSLPSEPSGHIPETKMGHEQDPGLESDVLVENQLVGWQPAQWCQG